jgi:hypothetical protein
MPRLNLLTYFDRVVLINLKRRPDRLKQAQDALRQCRWPFKWPEVFEAVDGSTALIPPHFKHGPGAWGCLKSHKQILEQAVKDHVRNILILEDDICFVDNFRKLAEGFLQLVPDDWDQLMLGGQHMSKPIQVKPGIFRCAGCERTHCYAVRGEFMGKLIERWSGGGKFQGNGHCDWIMGRDSDLQPKYRVYAPVIFLVGQSPSNSDVTGQKTPRLFWNPPGPDLFVINLHAPPPVFDALREYGFHTGHGLDTVFSEATNDRAVHVKRLRDWLIKNQWQVASDPRLICTVWHTNAEPELVRAASPWRVLEITADSIQTALKQLPSRLRRPRAPELVEQSFIFAQFLDRSPPAPTAPLHGESQPAMPTTAQMATNFGKAMVGWAKDGFKLVQPEIYEQRRTICLACEHWWPEARMGTGMCRRCGCSGAKLWLASSVCPDRPPRWGQFESFV